MREKNTDRIKVLLYLIYFVVFRTHYLYSSAYIVQTPSATHAESANRIFPELLLLVRAVTLRPFFYRFKRKKRSSKEKGIFVFLFPKAAILFLLWSIIYIFVGTSNPLLYYYIIIMCI